VRYYQKFGLATSSYSALQLFTYWSRRKTSIGCGVSKTQKKSQATAQNRLAHNLNLALQYGEMGDASKLLLRFFRHQVAKSVKIFPESLTGHHSKLCRLREAEIPVQLRKLRSGFSVERSQNSEI
jgi:hypothetical protein